MASENIDVELVKVLAGTNPRIDAHNCNGLISPHLTSVIGHVQLEKMVFGRRDTGRLSC